MRYTRRGRIVVSWTALPPPVEIPACPRAPNFLPGGKRESDPELFERFLGDPDAVAACPYHAYDIPLIAHITARAHQSQRRLDLDELVEAIAEPEGAPRAETDVAKSLLEFPIRYSRKTRIYAAKPEWACAMIAAKVPAVVVEQTNR